MAKEDKKEEQPARSPFGDILENLAKKMIKKVEMPPPTVKTAVVEDYAARMMSFGYEFNENTLSILADYLKGYNLWLCGNVGVGKTFFFDCMNRVRYQRGFEPIEKLSMIETQGWNMDTAREWASDTRDYDVLIDDVGTEPLMKSWGQEAEVFPYLLEKRMQLSNRRTHLTSNLGAQDINRRYHERVSDRFVQYFKMEIFKARESRRSLRPWKRSQSGDGVA